LRFDLRRSVARLPVRHDAAACRSCVGTTTPKAAAVAKIGAALAARKRGELLRLGRPCVGRPEPWLQAGKYVSALVSDLPRRNGWTIAQRVGDRTPQRTQRLLNRACWDTFAAMGVVRRFAVAGLDEAARRCGRRSGTAVHLSYVRENTGHALIGARQWIPQAHIDDPVRSLVMGLEFRTKGQLAIDICTEAFADGIRPDFICGDEVYGNCAQLREFFEGRGQGVCAAGG